MSDGRIRLMMTTSVIYSRRYSRFGRCERDLAAHAGIPGLGGVSRRIGPAQSPLSQGAVPRLGMRYSVSCRHAEQSPFDPFLAWSE